MIVPANNSFAESKSPHSLGLQNNLTIPNPGFDQNPLLINEKRFWGGGMQGLRGLSFDGTGFLGTGLFSGDYTTWGISELIVGVIGIYAMYSMFHQSKHTGMRLEQSAHGRRKRKAASYRIKAQQLEEKQMGGWLA